MTFQNAKSVTFFLTLTNNRVSGGKLLNRANRRKANRLGQALRQCAVTIRRSPTWLGAKHRRRLARMEKAVKATAHEIARLIYAMLRDGAEYVELSLAEFESEYLELKIYQSDANSNGDRVVTIHLFVP